MRMATNTRNTTHTWTKSKHGHMSRSTSPSAPHVPLTDDDRATLEALIQSEYKKNVVEKCDICNKKECRQYFCVPCKEGALCEKNFRNRDLPHYEHSRVRVSQPKNAYVSRLHDLTCRMPVTKEIAVYENHSIIGYFHYLRKRDHVRGSRIWCHGCQKHVSNAYNKHIQRWNADYARVCSIECFLVYDLACRTSEAEAVREGDEERLSQQVFRTSPMRSPLQDDQIIGDSL